MRGHWLARAACSDVGCCVQVRSAPRQLLVAWASHGDLYRVLVPRAENNFQGAVYRVKDPECQSAEQTPAAVIDSILAWQQRRLWAEVRSTKRQKSP